jgi:DNA mismatch repair ATPase MutS
MKNPLEFYVQQKTELEKEAAALKRKSLNLSVLRFIVFLVTCGLVYFTLGSYSEVIIVAFSGFFLFSFLVLKYHNLKRKKEVVEAKIHINKTEIKVLDKDFHYLKSGEEFVNPAHFYSNDIDLFGKGSFFQYLNRTATIDGKTVLADTLTENKITAILEKQNALKELSEKVLWRQHFSALASLVVVKNTSKSIVDWISNYTSALPKYLIKVQIGFSLISLSLIGFLSFSFISFSYLIIWFFVGLFISSKFGKKTLQIYTEIDKISDTFRQYHKLLNEIENEEFTSEILKNKKGIIKSEEKKASSIVKEFSKILNTFDQRNNDVIAIIGNGLFLFEIYNACTVEKWIFKYQYSVKAWFEVVAFFDAQNSLANFNFNHPKFVFPEISYKKEIIKSAKLGHPLLKVDKRIDNNFSIDDAQFFIITGANMAGKSTFLRTVSLSIVMANCGLTVCAESFQYSPVKLITSMRTSDSLTDDESYFYSELKRLKFIVDEIKGEKYFIILDEILKGTNSKDKAIGSKKFVEKLTKSKSTGIIATHDVSLCELENEFSGIKNYYFDAEIIKDELYFDYTLKNGVCKNMNASFLLKKMEIV